MFLGAYYFDGAPTELLPAYRRLLDAMDAMPPGAMELQLCVASERGITVLDACPSREIFELFSTSAELSAMVEAAGLPQPRVEPMGELHHTIVPGVGSR